MTEIPDSDFVTAAKRARNAHLKAQQTPQAKIRAFLSGLWPKKKEWPPAPDKPMSWAIEYLVWQGIPKSEALQALRVAARERKITVAGVRGPNTPGLGQRYGSLRPIWVEHWDEFCIDPSGKKTEPAPGTTGLHEGMTCTSLRVNEEEIRALGRTMGLR